MGRTERAISISHLKQVFEKESPHFFDNWWRDREFETVRPGYGRTILIVIQFIINLHSEDDKVIDLVNRMNDSAKCYLQSIDINADLEKFYFYDSLVSFMEEKLKVFFSVPKGKLTETTNGLVAVFVDFLIDLLEIILQHRYHGYYSNNLIKGFQTELKFLFTFLGDTPSQLTGKEQTNRILADIEELTNEVGSHIYLLILKHGSMRTGMDLTISDFQRKIEVIKMKIKKHVQFMQSGLATKSTSVISIFNVDSLVDNLMDQKDNMIGEVKDQIRTVHDELLYFRDINIRRDPELAQVLMMRITGAACELEYLINSFAPLWYLKIRLPHFVEKIKLIRMEYEQMKKNESGRLQVTKYPREPGPLQAGKPLKPEEMVVGFEDEAMKIKDQLLEGSKHQKIISIFGMPGLGKTTLAQKIYYDPSIEHYFHKRAWCVVSQAYQKRNILIDILRSLSELDKDAIADMEDDDLGQTIYQSLKRMTYLIVIDDIWNVEAWEDLERYFPDDQTQSRILFTTRIKGLASQASPHSLLNELPFLSETRCWDLLQRKVYCPPKLQEIGKEIAANCHGLPLAVVLIAAVLANTDKEEHSWQQIATNLSSHITDDPNKCMNVLELSFNNLPVHLKPCFLYLAMFEEDKEIPMRKLISLWIAEGFILKEEYKNMEVVAEEYLTDLIGRSLLIVASRRSDGGVKTCRIHDLLRDMCLKIAKKANLLKVIENQKQRCIGMCMHSNLLQSRFFGLHVSSLYDIPDPYTLTLQILRFLKVLQVSTTDSNFYEDVIRIKMPVYLRYMAVPCMFKSIEWFKKLEFLYVDNKELYRGLDVFQDIGNLRHLHFRGSAKFSSDCHWRAASGDCFPRNKLQNVSILFISDEKDEEIMRCFPHLYRLKCKLTLFCDKKMFAFRYAVFDFLPKLETLSASFDRTYISGAHVGFTSLPSNLKKLTLHGFDLSWKEMGMIGTIPNLMVFKLRHGSIEKNQWDASKVEFKELRYLKLDGVPIVEWFASRDNFPKLEQLVLRKCYRLKEIPSDLGYIATLLTMEVQSCKKSAVESALQIEEEQREMGNEEFKVIISRSQGFVSKILEIFEKPPKQ